MPATASARVTGLSGAPVEHVWRVTLAALATQGWAVDVGRTTVTVEREVFRRERVFSMIQDQPISTEDPARVGGGLERRLLTAIARAL
jgi:hypothetical protein